MALIRDHEIAHAARWIGSIGSRGIIEAPPEGRGVVSWLQPLLLGSRL